MQWLDNQYQSTSGKYSCGSCPQDTTTCAGTLLGLGWGDGCVAAKAFKFPAGSDPNKVWSFSAAHRQALEVHWQFLRQAQPYLAPARLVSTGRFENCIRFWRPLCHSNTCSCPYRRDGPWGATVATLTQRVARVFTAPDLRQSDVILLPFKMCLCWLNPS